MKKDKEWLKGLINEEGIVMNMNLLDRLDGQYWKNENIKINKGRLFYLIDQLDGPEIEENFYTFDNAKKWLQENGFVVFEKDKLDEEVQRMIDETYKTMNETPVIPQFVADLIEHYKRAGDCLGELLAHIEYDDVLKPKLKMLSEVVKWVYPDDFSDSEDRIDLIARAWLDGYEVEKEKRYYIINKENNATLMTFELSDVVGEEIIEFVYAYSENETIHFDSKEKAELIAHFVGDFVEVEEVTK